MLRPYRQKLTDRAVALVRIDSLIQEVVHIGEVVFNNLQKYHISIKDLYGGFRKDLDHYSLMTRSFMNGQIIKQFFKSFRKLFEYLRSIFFFRYEVEYHISQDYLLNIQYGS